MKKLINSIPKVLLLILCLMQTACCTVNYMDDYHSTYKVPISSWDKVTIDANDNVLVQFQMKSSKDKTNNETFNANIIEQKEYAGKLASVFGIAINDFNPGKIAEGQTPVKVNLESTESFKRRVCSNLNSSYEAFITKQNKLFIVPCNELAKNKVIETAIKPEVEKISYAKAVGQVFVLPAAIAVDIVTSPIQLLVGGIILLSIPNAKFGM